MVLIGFRPWRPFPPRTSGSLGQPLDPRWAAAWSTDPRECRQQRGLGRGPGPFRRASFACSSRGLRVVKFDEHVRGESRARGQDVGVPPTLLICRYLLTPGGCRNTLSLLQCLIMSTPPAATPARGPFRIHTPASLGSQSATTGRRRGQRKRSWPSWWGSRGVSCPRWRAGRRPIRRSGSSASFVNSEFE